MCKSKQVFEVSFDGEGQGKDCWWFVAYSIKSVKHWMKKRAGVFEAKGRPLPPYRLNSTTIDPATAIAHGSIDYNIT